MRSVEIIVRRTRRPSRCAGCQAEIPAGTMVHAVPGADGRPRAVHVACDLDRMERERLAQRERYARDAARMEFGHARGRRA